MDTQFEILPAIDLKGGRAVRLRQGEAASETPYSDDPVDVAQRFAQAGATVLHVVDLDGAFAGAPVHLPLVARICRETRLPVRLGGGLRRTEDIEAAFEAGVSVAILGTVAIEQPVRLSEWIGRFGTRVAASLDVRNGTPATRGWLNLAPLSLEGAAAMLAGAGVEDLVVTDVARDGGLSGPNLPLLRQVAQAFGMAVIAAGGVARPEDLRLLREEPAVRGVVIGRAFYEGTIPLEVLSGKAS